MKKKVLTALVLSSTIVASSVTKDTITVFASDNDSLGKSVNVQKIKNMRDNTPVINGINVNKQLINTNYSVGITTVPKYIVIHDTDNRQFGSNAMANRDYFANDPEAKASAHYTVDQSNIIQVLEDNWYGWHVGDGDNPIVSNSNTIGIELCVNPDNNFNKTLENGIALTKYLMKKYKIPASNVIRHYDVSGKICPKMMIQDRPDLWVYFKNAISSVEVRRTSGQTVNNSQSNYRLQGNSTTVTDNNKKSSVSKNSTSNNQKPSIKKGKTEVDSVLILRNGPGKDYSIVRYLLNNTEVDIKGEYGDWYLINANGIEGYAFKNYIKTSSSITTSSENKTINKQGIVTDISTNLTVRKGPGVKYYVVGYLLNDTKVKIIGRENGWYKIEFNTNTGVSKGYVNSDFVKVLS